MNENVNVCITPKGDKPVLHFSQFDNERVFTVTVLADDGESAVDLTDLDIEFRLRKTDSHVVTIAPISVVSNVITFLTTEQLCACCGQNIASVVIMNNDSVISTLDILVDIQRDILSGGLTSESDIRNLTTQIEQIVPEVVGDDYYNKQEVDDLLAEHTFDPSNYYDKSDVNGLLADKADASDVYSKGETDTLLLDKADKSDVYSKSQTDTLLLDKADKSDVYSKSQTDSLLYFKADKINDTSASDLPADVVTLDNAGNDCPMSELTVAVTAVQEGTGTPSPSNPRAISGFSGANINVADENMVVQKTTSISFGQEVYGGVLDVINGKLTITHKGIDLGTLTNWVKDTGSLSVTVFRAYISDRKTGSVDLLCSNYQTVTPRREALNSNNNAITTWNDTDSPIVAIRDDSLSSGDTSAFTTAMSGVQLVYELATPVEIDLTPAEVDTISGINNIYADTGNILTLRYFGSNAENLFKYIRLIKG